MRLQADRHPVAALNMAAKPPMCRPPPLAAKVIRGRGIFEVDIGDTKNRRDITFLR